MASRIFIMKGLEYVRKILIQLKKISRKNVKTTKVIGKMGI
jgi:hypothetical protein